MTPMRWCPATWTTGLSMIATGCSAPMRAHQQRNAEIPAGLASCRPGRCRRQLRRPMVSPCRGKSVLAGVGIRHFDAGIPHFGKAELSVKAEGGGDASRLLACCRQSPLHKQYGETLDNIIASGLAAVDFDLDLPLHAGGGAGNWAARSRWPARSCAEQRWELAFDGVRGRAEYGHGGFAADKLAVRHDGQPGKLSLRAGDYTCATRSRPSKRNSMRRWTPRICWIARRNSPGSSRTSRAFARGRSALRDAEVVGGATAPPTRLQLRSDLVGTALTLPAPLDKPAAMALPTTVDTACRWAAARSRSRFGERARLARAQPQRPDRRARRAGQPSRRANRRRPRVWSSTGRAATLDALDWIGACQRGSGDGGGRRLSLRRIDVTAARLRLLGADVSRHAPAGAPSAARHGGAGRRRRARRRGAVAAMPTTRPSPARFSGCTGAVAQAPECAPRRRRHAGSGRSHDVDPARIPPLSLDIDDLRFGDAQLGSAALRTRPLANGLQHRTVADARAEATHRRQRRLDRPRRTPRARSLRPAIDSEDFGALLGGLGYGGQLAGGHGTARFDAALAGQPGAISAWRRSMARSSCRARWPAAEVEPGAGRVLGLLSLAQLPRRLTLDFRDFFSKGFAFDQLEGDVRIGAGMARSDDLVIDGPAAEIHIRGSRRPARADVRPDHRSAAQGRQPADRGRRDRRRAGRRGGRRGRQRGAEEAAGAARRQDLSRHRPVERTRRSR